MLTDEMKQFGILIQDRAAAHTANFTKQYLEDYGINFKTQSPMSPDMNPIEKFWSILKRKTEIMCPKNKEQLIEAIQRGWMK